MSAINYLKNLVAPITGKLFTSAKNNSKPQNEIHQADEKTGDKPREGMVSVIGGKKDYEAIHQLSDFTIF